MKVCHKWTPRFEVPPKYSEVEVLGDASSEITLYQCRARFHQLNVSISGFIPSDSVDPNDSVDPSGPTQCPKNR